MASREATEVTEEAQIPISDSQQLMTHGTCQGAALYFRMS